MPTPARGIIADMAREAGISSEGMRKRYMRGDPKTVVEVARRTRQRLQEEQAAARALLDAFRRKP
jgi:hypothetical protein